MKKNLNNSRISKGSSRMGSRIREDSEDKSIFLFYHQLDNYVYMVHKFGP